MDSFQKKHEKIVDQFLKEIKELFGDQVLSVILFGSVSTEDYIPKKSDYNFVVVLEPEAANKIGKVHQMVRRWQRRNISLPLFLTESYISNSLDSFPIEFFNMLSGYRVIFGKDVLADLPIDPSDLRLQCERELKGKLLQLRQGYVSTRGRKIRMRSLVDQSIVTFSSIFRSLLHLKGKEVPKKKIDVIKMTCKEFGLDEILFSKLWSMKEGKVHIPKNQLEAVIESYISEIEKLSEQVDRIAV